jgi:hypothetical protein
MILFPARFECDQCHATFAGHLQLLQGKWEPHFEGVQRGDPELAQWRKKGNLLACGKQCGDRLDAAYENDATWMLKAWEPLRP